MRCGSPTSVAASLAPFLGLPRLEVFPGAEDVPFGPSSNASTGLTLRGRPRARFTGASSWLIGASFSGLVDDEKLRLALSYWQPGAL